LPLRAKLAVWSVMFVVRDIFGRPMRAEKGRNERLMSVMLVVSNVSRRPLRAEMALSVFAGEWQAERVNDQGLAWNLIMVRSEL
jgi:hypothetical protein